MKIIKRLLLTGVLLAAAGFLFRGWLYRQLVTYKSAGFRPNYPATNKTLIDYLNASNTKQYKLNAAQIVKQSLVITSQKLNFTAGKNDNDPNKLIKTKKAHCVGYASFFATTCNYLMKQNGLGDTWKAKPRVGQLYFLGANIHRYFNSPFFKDHDFVTIENEKTRQVLAVDPTVDDYLDIDFVHYSE